MSFVAPYGYGYAAPALNGSWVRPSVLAGSYVAPGAWGAGAWNGAAYGGAWNGAAYGGAWNGAALTGAWGAAPLGYAGAWGAHASYAAPAFGGWRSNQWW